MDRRTFLRTVAAGTAAFADLSLLAASRPTSLPTVPYGAVYFRKSNPPEPDWDRDYRQAAADGMNAFRHWFMWPAIETAPGEYEWDDYDRQMDLAARHGLRTIIGEFLGAAPEWAFRKYPHAQVQFADGSVAGSQYIRASAIGGWPGLCLDNDEVRAVAERYLRALAGRYRDHPAMAGYDVWNELNHNGDAGGCYCEASAEKFRAWLRNKYGNLEALSEAWRRYGYTSWADVRIPRSLGPYPDNIDWALFRVDNSMRLFEWRVGVLRAVDDKNPITAHAISKAVLDRVGPKVYPVFQAARLVDIYGYTGGGSHDEASRLRWQHWCSMDLTRSAARGKPFWCGEMAAGANWRWRSGRELDEGRVATASDVRLYSLMHFAGGTRGIFSPRWRPLQEGPFAGSFAFYDMDGSTTERSEAAGEMARWANANERKAVMAAKPVAGDIGILVVPESQIHCYVSEGSTDDYHSAVTGAYQGFLFNNIQADLVPIDEIGPSFDALYLPYPVMLSRAHAQAIEQWVRAGGRLISEGCPAYYGDHGRVGASQPNHGLDQMFGAKQRRIQLTPDLLGDLELRMKAGYSVRGGVFLQSYEPTTGRSAGTFATGEVAAVDNDYGKGRTRLVGTFPGCGYARSPDDSTKRFFADALSWAGKQQHVESSDERMICRLQAGPDQERYLWCVNADRAPVSSRVKLADRWGGVHAIDPVWGDGAKLTDDNGEILVTIPARDAVVIKLRGSSRDLARDSRVAGTQ